MPCHASMRSVRSALGAAAVALLALAAGCATVPPDAGRSPADPLEKFNRQVDEFNYQLDRVALKPAAKAYQAVVPAPVRTCVTNFFGNIGDVPSAVNSLLQGKVAEAATGACRVVLNSTVGVLGCFDVARTMGLPRASQDFGLTLGHWGAGPGAYIVLPLFGPSDVRDALGKAVDIEADPFGYVRPMHDVYIGDTLRVVDTRANLLQASGIVEGVALDRYSFFRDAYLQRRRNLVYDGNPPPEKYDEDDSPDEPTPGSPPAKASTPDQPAPAVPR